MTIQYEKLGTSDTEVIETMKSELDEGAKRIGKQFDEGEIDDQEFKKQILALIDNVTNPKHE